MHWFRSHWYYWYIGRKKVALVSMSINFLLLTALLSGFFSLSLWSIALALLLDAAGFLVLAIYLISLRSHIPELILVQTDNLVLSYLVIPVIIAFILSRFITFLVAKAFKAI